MLAAHRAGIRTVILPARNDRDVEDVPEELRREMRFILVDDAEEVLQHALAPVVDARSAA
jgi:ATP-dependent Lon protease